MIIDHSIMKRLKEQMAQMTREQKPIWRYFTADQTQPAAKQKQLSNKCPQGKTRSPKIE